MVLAIPVLMALGLCWVLRRLGWRRGSALAGGVVGSYALSLAWLFGLDPANLPDGGRILAAAIWGFGHLVLFLALWPIFGRARRT